MASLRCAAGARVAVSKSLGSSAAPRAPVRLVRHVVRAAGDESAGGSVEALGGMTGIVFQPFEEVQLQMRELDSLMESQPNPGAGTKQSLARMNYASKLEAAVNEQINVEYNMSYIYASLAAYFDRDDVGLPGFSAYFKHSSDEEREHAHLLVTHQNRRGGRVLLQTIVRPQSEFNHADKGDALFASELALALEKLNFGKLRELHDVASECGDSEWTHFIEDYLLHNQAKEVKYAANLVSQLQRVGKGHGVFHVDLALQKKYGEHHGDPDALLVA